MCMCPGVDHELRFHPFQLFHLVETTLEVQELGTSLNKSIQTEVVGETSIFPNECVHPGLTERTKVENAFACRRAMGKHSIALGE